MENTDTWRNLFENWPDSIERRGAVVTRHGDAIPFSNFLISGSFLLLDRGSPDANGARKVLLTYDGISVIKLSTTAQLSKFQAMGFQATC